jgi:uncharacterized protein
VSLERSDGFAPGRHNVEGYGAGGFSFGGLTHRGSILLTPSGVTAIAARTSAQITLEMLEPLFAEPVGAVDLVLFGTGADIAVVPAALREALRGRNLRVEVMATGAAARTLNVLIDENRRVAAVLIAAP